MKLYVYCLAEGVDDLAGGSDKPNSVSGIAGAPVRSLKIGNFVVLVSDFAGDVVPVTRENALAHAAVVQSVLDVTTPLPFRFGALVTEQQLENYVSSRHEALKSQLERVRGCVEMSVKIIWDRGWAEQPAAISDRDKPGTAFLSEKRQQILGGEARTAEAKRVAEWLESQIHDVVKETRMNANPTEKLIIAAAHLVERDRVQQYRTQVAEARRERPELHFLVSGPWPPYSFANIDLEFKTQFGVS